MDEGVQVDKVEYDGIIVGAVGKLELGRLIGRTSSWYSWRPDLERKIGIQRVEGAGKNPEQSVQRGQPKALK